MKNLFKAISFITFFTASLNIYGDKIYRWEIRSDSKIKISKIKFRVADGKSTKIEYGKEISSSVPTYISFAASRHYDDIYLDKNNIVKAFEELNSIKGLTEDEKLIRLVISPNYPRELATVRVYNGKKSIDLKYYRSSKRITGEEAQKGRDLREKLKKSYESTLVDKQSLNEFLTDAENVAKSAKDKHFIPFYLASYNTKLTIKFIKENKLKNSQKLINFYADNIITYVGYDKYEKTADLASNGIVVAIKLNDDKLFKKIRDKILGDDFDILWEENDILLFNLACYYSLKRERDMMLKAIKRARELGKPKERFLEDKDFEYYYEDKDFLNAIK